MSRVEVQKIPSQKMPAMEVLATFCYYFPQYKLEEARQLPEKYVRKLLQTAKQIEAGKYFNLTQIAAAPHTKKGQGVSKLSKLYEGMAKNG